MSKNSNRKSSFVSRFAGKGYYIALALCAMAIGISGYLYYRNASTPENPDATVDVLGPSATNPTQSTSPSTAPTTKPNIPIKQPLLTSKPVSGDKLMDYAMDCLCFNPTTRDWRVHNGVDFAAEAGAPVGAAADGTVYTIYTDSTMGTTVVIRHQDGYVTTYSSLKSDTPVSVGQVVTLGQTIGYASTSAMVELAIGDHVHFSVSCNGQSVDPEDFFELG